MTVGCSVYRARFFVGKFMGEFFLGISPLITHWLVVSTHLKNMLIKFDHFPRVEHKKHLKPPSPLDNHNRNVATVDGPKIWRFASWDGKSPNIYTALYIPGGWEGDFWTINSMRPGNRQVAVVGLQGQTEIPRLHTLDSTTNPPLKRITGIYIRSLYI